MFCRFGANLSVDLSNDLLLNKKDINNFTSVSSLEMSSCL